MYLGAYVGLLMLQRKEVVCIQVWTVCVWGEPYMYRSRCVYGGVCVCVGGGASESLKVRSANPSSHMVSVWPMGPD